MEQQEAGCSLEGWQVPNQTTLLASVCLKQHSSFSRLRVPPRQLMALFPLAPCRTIMHVSCTDSNFNDLCTFNGISERSRGVRIFQVIALYLCPYVYNIFASGRVIVVILDTQKRLYARIRKNQRQT